MEKASVKEIINGFNDTKYITPRGLKKFLLEQVYPVGSIYLSLSSVSPDILFGGVWEKVATSTNLPVSNGVSIASNGIFQFKGGYGENIGIQTPNTVINKNGGTGNALLVNNNDVTGTKVNTQLIYYTGLSGTVSNVISGVNVWKRVK